jgi:hypothetical protein
MGVRMASQMKAWVMMVLGQLIAMATTMASALVRIGVTTASR